MQACIRGLLHWTVACHLRPALIDIPVYTWKLGFFKSVLLFPFLLDNPCLWVDVLSECFSLWEDLCWSHFLLFQNPWLFFNYVVSPFYSIRICSLLLPLPLLLGLIFGLCFWSASVSGLCLILKACWCWFPSSFVGYLYFAKVLTCLLCKPSFQVEFMLTLVHSRVCWVVV